MTVGVVKRIGERLAQSHADRVAVVRLEGHIGSVGSARGGLTAAGIEGTLKHAFTLDRVKAVALVINSPGGSPAQSEYIAERIRQLGAENGVRVLAFCEDIAASGGYWIACAADEIFTARTSMVGSIGVISSGFGVPEVLDKFGIERRVYTAGEAKSRLDVFSPEKADDVAWLQGLQANLHAAFIGWVRQRRGTKLVGTDAELFSGDVWIGQRAVDTGLVDGVGVLRSVLAERYPDAHIQTVSPPKPLLSRITGGQLGVADAVEAVLTGLLSSVDQRARWMSFGL